MGAGQESDASTSTPAENRSVEQRAVARLTVLVVEDNPFDVELMQRLLEAVPEYDFEFHRAGDLGQAVAVLEHHTPDVIILDLNLPDSSGLETLRTMQRSYSQIPIVVVTGVTSEDSRREILRSGAQDCIDKNDPPLRLLAHNILYAIERHQAHRRQADLEQLVRLNPDGIIVCDSAGNLCVQNDAARQLFEHADDVWVREFIAPAATDGRIVEVEFPGAGGTTYCELHASDLNWDGAPARLITVRDRTRERHLADQVRESQKMNAIGRLAGGVSHDFNNLLTVIIGYTDLLLRKRVSADDVDEMLVEIQQAGNRAKALTSQLLAFSRKSNARPELLDVPEVVHELRKMLHRIIGDHIELAMAPHADVSPVLMDRGHLEQVVLNLVVNARDAMPKGGTVSLSFDTLQIGGREQYDADLQPGTYTRIGVTDNGIGIGDDVIDQIFEPFFTTKVMGVGTGLGLATTYGIARQYGGSVVVESAVGKGSTFNVLLPAAPEREVHLGDDVARRGDLRGSGEHVLYVEDDDFVRRVTQLELIDAGYEVTTVSGAGEAIDLVRSNGWHYDVIVSDVSMPGMTGFALLRQLRSEIEVPIRALFTTGYTPEDERRNDNLANDQVLQKPFEREELLGCIRSVLQKTHSS
jgi:two-component system cell cycle sensor histidine kinase/response regulator CckA